MHDKNITKFLLFKHFFCLVVLNFAVLTVNAATIINKEESSSITPFFFQLQELKYKKQLIINKGQLSSTNILLTKKTRKKITTHKNIKKNNTTKIIPNLISSVIAAESNNPIIKPQKNPIDVYQSLKQLSQDFLYTNEDTLYLQNALSTYYHTKKRINEVDLYIKELSLTIFYSLQIDQHQQLYTSIIQGNNNSKTTTLPSINLGNTYEEDLTINSSLQDTHPKTFIFLNNIFKINTLFYLLLFIILISIAKWFFRIIFPKNYK